MKKHGKKYHSILYHNFVIPLFMLLFVLLLSSLIPIKAAAEDVSLPIYYVRFSGQGLNIYAEPSLSGEPLAVLPDETYVQIILGPLDSLVKIRVFDTGLEGYTDMRYLKRLDDIVYDYDAYTYEELEEDILLLQERYPDLLHANIIGASVDGRNLYELVMGNETAPKHIFVQAGIHAREYTNPYLVMEQLEQCLNYYDSGYFHDRSYHELFANTAVHVIPMINPDGIAISQFGESAIRSPELVQTVRACYEYDKSTRRTKSSYEEYLVRWKANARGVDLNRNFPIGFGVDMKPSQPSQLGYAGLFPFSEPETLSVANTILYYKPCIVVSYHSMGEIAYWDSVDSRYRQINREFSSYMLSLIDYKRMGSGNHSTGSFMDWLYTCDTPVCSITFETGNEQCPLSPLQYPKIWSQHYMVLPTIAEYAYTH